MSCEEDILMSQDSSADLYHDAVETQFQDDKVVSSASYESHYIDSRDQFAGDNDEFDRVGNEIVIDLSEEDDGDGDVDMDRGSEVGENHGVSDVVETALKPRNYQLEMLEESLKKNIIVAMDTGSGKTLIAVLRIAAELDRAPPDKLVWFMAPTVALCEQQYGVLEEQLPCVQIRFLSSADNVDRWGTQDLWDTVLHNVRVVVSTYRILLDALTHGFVKMDSIALLVFDEAHNCVKLSPGSQIMRDFYMPRAIKSREVPHILGLSASPIMDSSVVSVEKIEESLNAICRTPRKHRAQLLQQVKLPETKRVLYMPLPEPQVLTNATATLASLHKVYEGLNIQEDPYIRKLKAENTERSERKLKKAFKSRGTYCQDQFKTLCLTSTSIFQELGGWAADFYISNAISRFTSVAVLEASYFERFDLEEKKYLAEALKKVRLGAMATASKLNVSDKVDKFIETLVSVYHPGISGIVFVRQRATVAVLAHILSTHLDTKDLFNVGTFVGISQDPRRITNIGDMLNVQNQSKALEDFRSGAINLIVATSALEEGIDVPTCDTVLCFNNPDNLKVLVQRRGRARSHKSKLILMFDGKNDKVDQWLEFEKYMKQIYADDMRKLKEIEALENLYQPGHREFMVEETGALLNFDNAVQHLYHFCAKLPENQYADLRPDFICDQVNERFVKATVILPLCVNEKFRLAESQQAWPSERDAVRDASFEACMNLYRGGLINNNLLSNPRDTPDLQGVNMENKSSQLDVSEQLNPWINAARLLNKNAAISLYEFSVRVTDNAGILLPEMKMLLPNQLSNMTPIRIYWDSTITLTVVIRPVTPHCAEYTAHDIKNHCMETAAIIRAAYGHRFSCSGIDFPAIFTAKLPSISNLLRYPEQEMASSFVPGNWQASSPLIRDVLNKNRPCLYHESLASKPDEKTIRRLHRDYESFSSNVPYLALKPVSKRADFLHPVPSENSLLVSGKQYHYVSPASECLVDKLPLDIIKFALIMPSILHRISVQMVADTLSSKILQSVAFSSLVPVITAISAPVAREGDNYQRLEFLGDSALKFCTSVQLFTDNPTWHEGYLSGEKDQYISNARLAKAAREKELDKFILTKPFTGDKWRPAYVSELLKEPQEKRRKISVKMLADVVEALLGAAMVDGGISKVVECLKIFIPEIEWKPMNINRDKLFDLPTSDIPMPSRLAPLQGLIGYIFQKSTLLIESMTHGSHTAARTSSLERLEFLGDSILDSIIVQKVFNHTKQLPVPTMHLMRTALVNADFLAFMGMELVLDCEKVDLVENKDTKKFETVKSTKPLPLWTFMSHMSQQISNAQKTAMERHGLLRDEINSAINSSDHYPWILLARLHAPKFFSDIVESLLGAMWIDSGSMNTCERLLEQMGILPYLRRIVEEDVHLWHPKEELGKLADKDKVKYEFDQTKLFCKVFIGTRLVGEGRLNGESDKEVLRGIAAEKAIKLIKAERELKTID